MDNNEDREGAELDERDACKLFKDMGFAVEKYRNLKLSVSTYCNFKLINLKKYYSTKSR